MKKHQYLLLAGLALALYLVAQKKAAAAVVGAGGGDTSLGGTDFGVDGGGW
jgi:hypothetical protein